MLSAPVLQAPVLQAPVLSAPVLPAPVILSVIYAVLTRIRICRNLRVFGANSSGPNLYLCYSNRFLHLCSESDELTGTLGYILIQQNSSDIFQRETDSL